MSYKYVYKAYKMFIIKHISIVLITIKKAQIFLLKNCAQCVDIM